MEKTRISTSVHADDLGGEAATQAVANARILSRGIGTLSGDSLAQYISPPSSPLQSLPGGQAGEMPKATKKVEAKIEKATAALRAMGYEPSLSDVLQFLQLEAKQKASSDATAMAGKTKSPLAMIPCCGGLLDSVLGGAMGAGKAIAKVEEDDDDEILDQVKPLMGGAYVYAPWKME